MSSEAMNNNPMGVQQTMQPVTPPSVNSPAVSNPFRERLINPGAPPPMPNGIDAVQPDGRDLAIAAMRNYVNPGAGKSYDGPRINPFFKPQGRDPQNPSQFAVQNIFPGGGNFVDRGGQIQPRLDTSMARNLMAGQPEGGSRSFGQPMNVPGATQTLGGQVVSPPQRYGQERVIPGAFRGMTSAEGDMHGMSPDAFRVATGGQAMIPYVPSGTPATDGRTAWHITIANRNARARGVRGSDVAEWRATNPSSLIRQIKNEQQPVVADRNAAVDQRSSQGDMATQSQDPANQFKALVNPFAQATLPPVSLTQPGSLNDLRGKVGLPPIIDRKWFAPGLFTHQVGLKKPKLSVPDNRLMRNAWNPFTDRPNQEY